MEKLQEMVCDDKIRRSTISGGKAYYFILEQDSDVISPPVIHTSVFVSSLLGSDDNDGLSLETPVASLKWAVSLAVSGTRPGLNIVSNMEEE